MAPSKLLRCLNSKEIQLQSSWRVICTSFRSDFFFSWKLKRKQRLKIDNNFNICSHFEYDMIRALKKSLVNFWFFFFEIVINHWKTWAHFYLKSSPCIYFEIEMIARSYCTWLFLIILTSNSANVIIPLCITTQHFKYQAIRQVFTEQFRNMRSKPLWSCNSNFIPKYFLESHQILKIIHWKYIFLSIDPRGIKNSSAILKLFWLYCVILFWEKWVSWKMANSFSALYHKKFLVIGEIGAFWKWTIASCSIYSKNIINL